MTSKLNRYLQSCAILAFVAASPTATLAQQSDDAERAAEDEASNEPRRAAALEEIVITGTSRARSGLNTPLSLTSLDEKGIRRYSASSQADILRSIPTIKAEGGGGEVAANVFIKGLPSGGQFQFTPLQYDGVPVFSSFGLNSSAFDVYYRNDLGIERLEFVRGGVSNLFGAGSVAGLINYISKTGSEESESTVQLEWADEGRFRGDFATSGPLGGKDSNTFYALSGFYRYDEGPLKSGLPSEGFQLRGNIKREFEDNSGSFTIYGQWIDDSVQFFLPFPLTGDDRKRPTGNDGKIINTVQTDAAANLNFQTPDGVFETSIRDGASTEGGSVTVAFERDLDNGWGINARTKYARYSHEFNLFLDGDGIINLPETLSGFLDARGLGSLANASFTNEKSGQALAPGSLLFANRILDRNRPAEDFTAELNITKTLFTGAIDHSITLGGFFARAEADDENITTTFLAEFNDRPDLVNLIIQDENGNDITVSRNGLLNAGAGFVNNRHTATRFAGYIADQMEMDRWVFDIGLRVEKILGDISREGSQSFQVNDDPSLAPDLQSVIFGNGDFTIGEVDTSEWALALGALYKLTDNISLYANGARGFFFPEIRSVSFNSLGEPQTFKAEIIKQAEAGVKYNGPRFSGTLAGFYSELDDRRSVDFVNDGQGGVAEVTSIQSTRSYGIEATGSFYLTDALRLDGNVTFQDHKFTDFDSNAQFIGNELRRQPNLLFNTGVIYDDNRFDFAFFQTFVGNNFANDSNTVRLGSHNIARLDTGYTFSVMGAQTARIGFSVFNLFDSDGVTEGSPRQGVGQSEGEAFFVGRPILPRRYSVRLTYDF
ncbi:colicin I receptor [alpha proteobacterium Q-1]|nr:colicin I receptor [alpha proteobacterium Q-1]